jgi:hypothetical protein
VIVHHTPAAWNCCSCSAGVIVKKQDPLIWYLEMQRNEDMMSERAGFLMLLQCNDANANANMQNDHAMLEIP